MIDPIEQIISRCQTFERCGPLSASVFRVSGNSVKVVQECISWPEDIERKITKDSRISQLGDLLPLNRDGFGMALASLAERMALPDGVGRKPKGPGLG